MHHQACQIGCRHSAGSGTYVLCGRWGEFRGKFEVDLSKTTAQRWCAVNGVILICREVKSTVRASCPTVLNSGVCDRPGTRRRSRPNRRSTWCLTTRSCANLCRKLTGTKWHRLFYHSRAYTSPQCTRANRCLFERNLFRLTTALVQTCRRSLVSIGRTDQALLA
jgi:hypothetical protein